MEFLSVNTKGHCFMCLVEAGNSDQNGTRSLRSFCHHLKIDLGRLVESVNVGVTPSEGFEVKVVLCTECEKAVRKLEALRIEMDYWTKIVNTSMSKADKDTGLKEIYLQRMNGDLASFFQLKIVNELRKTLVERTSDASALIQPKIIIEKLEEDLTKGDRDSALAANKSDGNSDENAAIPEASQPAISEDVQNSNEVRALQQIDKLLVKRRRGNQNRGKVKTSDNSLTSKGDEAMKNDKTRRKKGRGRPKLVKPNISEGAPTSKEGETSQNAKPFQKRGRGKKQSVKAMPIDASTESILIDIAGEEKESVKHQNFNPVPSEEGSSTHPNPEKIKRRRRSKKLTGVQKTSSPFNGISPSKLGIIKFGTVNDKNKSVESSETTPANNASIAKDQEESLKSVDISGSRRSARSKAKIKYSGENILEERKRTKMAESHVEHVEQEQGQEDSNENEGNDKILTEMNVDVPPKNEIQCSRCPKKFKSQNGLKWHFESTHLSTRYRCKTCNSLFNSKGNLMQHQRRKQCFERNEQVEKTTEQEILDEDLEKTVNAEVSGSVLLESYSTERINESEKDGQASPTDLMTHREIDPETKRVRCKKCSVDFLNNVNFIRHFKTIHLKIKHQCQICNKDFSRSYELQRHEKTVHPVSNGGSVVNKEEKKQRIVKPLKVPRIKCNKCPKMCSSLATLQIHKRIHLGKKITYKCDLCYKLFATKGSMQKHREICLTI